MTAPDAPSPLTPTHDVAVIGCGLMGAELARTLARNGRSVSAWNRTHTRALALAESEPAITPIESIQHAVGSAPLVIVCTTTYRAALEAFSPVDDWTSTTVVNVGSGAPHEARQMATWARERGAEYLDGALFCYPYEIGRPGTMIGYSGSAEVWERHEETLLLLGGASLLFADKVETANQLLLATGGWFVASMTAYLESVGPVMNQEVPATAILRATHQMMGLMAYGAEEMTLAIDRGDFTTDQATIATFAQGARDAVAATQQDGRQSLHLAAAEQILNAGEAAGLGTLGFGALVQVLDRPDAEPA